MDPITKQDRYGTPDSSRVQSDLARRLSLPEPPAPYVSPFRFGAFFVIALTIVITMFMFGTMAHDGGFDGSALFLAVVLLPFAIWTIVILARFGRAESEKAAAESSLQLWQRMRKAWPSLYYCSLHGVVFREGQVGSGTPVEKIQFLALAATQ